MDSIKTKRHPKYYKDIEVRREKLRLISVPDLEGEKWLDVIGYEGYYKISSFARIKSVCRIATKKSGTTVIKPEQLLKPNPNSDGYLLVSITKDRVSKTYSFHILIAKLFVPNPLNLPEVNHIDGNKLNCLPINLEWGTHKYNMNHAVKTGLRRYENMNPRKKNFSDKEIIEIYTSTKLSSVLAREFGVTKSSIQRIKSGKTYSKITNNNNEILPNTKEVG